MPTVTRKKYISSGDYYDTVKRNVEWGALTESERKAVQKRYARRALGAIVAASAIGWGLGALPHDRDHAAITASLQTKATSEYRRKSALEKYEVAYISPFIVTTPGKEGGSRFLGGMKGSDWALKVGQSCLAGTAYDTLKSNIAGDANGAISAVAALAVEGNQIVVHPAGSNSVALKFSQDGVMLTPTSETALTLAANGCKPSEGVYASLTNDYVEFNDGEQDPNAWTTVAPLQ